MSDELHGSIDNSPPALTAGEARELIGRIRQTGGVLKAQILKAYFGRAWLALSYGSWDEMCDAEFGGRIALPRDSRQALHVELRSEGMSTRAIAAVTGVSNSTVHEDVADADCPESNSRVTSLDGRSRPATRPKPVEDDPVEADIIEKEQDVPPEISTRAEVAAERRARILQLNEEGWRTDQIAEEVGVSIERVSRVFKEAGVQSVSTRIGKYRTIDHDRLLAGLIDSVRPAPTQMQLIDDAFDDLDREQFAEWTAALEDAIRPVKALINRMKKEKR